MVTVAVTGGTGHFGRTLVDALKESTKHKVIVLARKAPLIQDPKAPIIETNYNDINSIATILESNNVHTVISTISVTSPESGNAEVNVVEAASRSEQTKRFIASAWGGPHPEDSPLPLYTLRNAISDALRKTGLEWTRFYNGIFLDYYGLPHVKSYLDPMPFVVDMAHQTAAIPGTGNELMMWTYSVDVAKFAIAALDLPSWEEKTYCYGDKMSWNTFLKLAEYARGSKFTVTYDNIEKLKNGQVTELPSHVFVYPFFAKPLLQVFLAAVEEYIVEGYYDLPEDKCLNGKFPDISTMKVKEMVDFWRVK